MLYRMAKSIYFFTKKKLDELLKMYGGSHRWTLHDELSEKTQISYIDQDGYMLTINKVCEGTSGQFTFVEIRISEQSGKIIRKDRFDFINTDTDDIKFVYTEENGHFYEDFRKVGMSMTITTEESKTKELEERVKSLQESLGLLKKRNNEMEQRIEDFFLNSPTYRQMKEEIDFYKSIAEDLKENDNDKDKKEDAAKVAELKKQIKKLQDSLKKSEGQCKVYQANMLKISESKEKAQRDFADARQKISLLENQLQSIFYRNNNPDFTTMYHALERRNETVLDNLKNTRKEAQEWKAKYEELKEKLSAMPPQEEPEKKQSKGRPKTDDSKIQQVLQMREDGKSMRTVAAELGISLGTVSNILKKHSE